MGESASCIKPRTDDTDTYFNIVHDVDVTSDDNKITASPNIEDVDPDFKPSVMGTYELVFFYFKLEGNNQYMIPKDIIQLCCKYCNLKQYNSLRLRKGNKFHVIQSKKEHIFDNIFIGQGGYICCDRSVLKLTVLGNLTIESNASINKDVSVFNGYIIINVFGCIHLKRYSQIITQNHGKIYIKCYKLKMDNDSRIKTSMGMDIPSNKIELHVRDKIEMKGNCCIVSNNVKIVCNEIQKHKTSKIIQLAK